MGSVPVIQLNVWDLNPSIKWDQLTRLKLITYIVPLGAITKPS